jgi:hypothetical protein
MAVASWEESLGDDVEMRAPVHTLGPIVCFGRVMWA